MSTLSELRGRLGSFLIFRGQEVIGIILMAAGLSLAFILFRYHASDPSLNRVGNIDIENWFGAYGAVIADLLYQFAGYGAWGIIPGLTALGWRYMRHASVTRPIIKFFFWVSGIILLSMAATIAPLHSDSFAPHAGGVLGQALVAPLSGWLDLLPGDTLTSLTNSITLWLWAAAAAMARAAAVAAPLSAIRRESASRPRRRRPGPRPAPQHCSSGASWGSRPDKARVQLLLPLALACGTCGLWKPSPRVQKGFYEGDAC